jgi:hypothetical protein
MAGAAIASAKAPMDARKWQRALPIRLVMLLIPYSVAPFSAIDRFGRNRY